MPYSLTLSIVLRKAGWQVKIYDAEGPEEPHVSVFRRGRKWRISLRTGKFLDIGDRWNQIDEQVKSAIETEWDNLKSAWDRLHGNVNPISNENEKKLSEEK